MKKPETTDSTIRIPSSQDFLPDVDSFLEGRLIDFGVKPSTIVDIAISVTEMVNNGIIHGNKQDTGKTVTVEVARINRDIRVTITDEGEGFDPDEVESPIDEKNLMKEVGRGIFIARSLMDEVSIESGPGRGTRVILTKQI